MKRHFIKKKFHSKNRVKEQCYPIWCKIYHTIEVIFTLYLVFREKYIVPLEML